VLKSYFFFPLLDVRQARPELSLPEPLPSFYAVISADEDATLKTIAQITTGITSIVEKVQNFLTYWEKKYKHMWDQDKEAYIRRYEKARKPLSAFDADISKYLELQDEVLSEDTSTNMRFLHIDCAPLKQALVGHCEAWVGKFTGLLNALAHAELKEIHDYFLKNTRALQKTPTNLDHLAESVNLQRKLVAEKEAVESRFEPLQEKYAALKKYDFLVRGPP
jgi:dynein heavy chain